MTGLSRLNLATLALLSPAACGRVEPGAAAPDFALPDTNPSSPTFGALVGQGTVTAHVSLWYFGHAN